MDRINLKIVEGPQGTLLQNNFQIGPVPLDKKIFKVLTMHI